MADWLAGPTVELELEGLWVADQAGALVGAVLARRLPGRTAQVWPAQAVTPDSSDVCAALVATVAEWLPQQGIRTAQALLDAEGGPEHAQLLASGFDHVADLHLQILFLDKRTATDARPELPEGVALIPYAPELRSRLSGIVARTYQDSLDCPRLDRRRDVEGLLEQYASHGESGTRNWHLVQIGAVDAGCLLLADDRSLGYCEIVYMGLAPEFRGRRIGSALVRFAQDQAQARGFARLTLAVDALNEPALEVYARQGFVTWETKRAYFREFGP
ncbi:MAG: GNAT family N-acetyltransferase [Planctomycetaceae bacterium]|nr:GNAT family N-acetyltransferase [Planctomycetaceae bacterium]